MRFFPFLLLVIVLSWPYAAAAVDLQDLIRKVETQYRGDSSHARVSMEIATAHWSRHLEMESWSYGRDYFLTRILEPPKERGVSTLKIKNEVWNYLPKVDRIIKVPASMMGGSWMGSHITNDDLVKASHVDRDYTFRLLEETADLYRIECLPKPDAAVVWGKLIYTIGKDPVVSRRVEYFDEAMVRVREIRFDEVQQIEDRAIPMRLTVQPLEKTQERTVMRYRSIAFGVDIGPGFFSLRSLKRR